MPGADRHRTRARGDEPRARRANARLPHQRRRLRRLRASARGDLRRRTPSEHNRSCRPLRPEMEGRDRGRGSAPVTGKQAFPSSITGNGSEPTGSVLDHTFGAGDPYTLGVEEEYQLLDPETFDLVQHIDTMLAAVTGHELEARINA